MTRRRAAALRRGAACALAASALLLGRAPARAQGRPRSTELITFQRELEAVFTDGGLTASEAARRATGAAPATARKRATAEAAAAEQTRARLALLPVLSGRASATQLSELPPARLSVAGQTLELDSLERAYAGSAQLAVPLSDYLLRVPAQLSAADHGVRAAQLDRQATLIAVDQQAREAYYEWLRSQLQVLVARRQLVQVESTLAQVQTLIDVQRASSADLLRVQSQRAQAQQAVARLTAAAELRQEQLRLLIGAGEDEVLEIGEDVRRELPLPDDLVAGGDDTDPLPALLAAATRRPELAAAAQRRLAKEAQRRAEAAALLPRISAVATVDYANPHPRVFPPRDEFEWTWSAGLQATWVINDALVGGATRRRLAAEAAELRADQTSAQHRARLEVLAAYQAVTLARSAIATSQQGLDAAEEGYRVRKDLFAAGRASVVEIVDVETELSRARIAALDARIDLRIAMERLAHATSAAPRAR